MIVHSIISNSPVLLYIGIFNSFASLHLQTKMFSYPRVCAILQIVEKIQIFRGWALSSDS